jgi:uncharacterized protein (DUF1015 family)
VSALFPFRALRSEATAAPRVAAVPYDVVSVEEARAIVANNPLSFLRVTRSEVDLPAGVSPYDSRVYDQAIRNFEELKRAAPLVIDDQPSLFVYRLRAAGHEQTGIAGCFSLDEYQSGLIKKHEQTRKDKEDDRTRHMIDLRAQTGLVFLTYRGSATVDAIVREETSARPLYDFSADDGVSHTVWQVPLSSPAAARFVAAFAAIPALYIADGHHRAASAQRTAEALDGGNNAECRRFVAVAFPDSQVRILPYNRVVRDLRGMSADEFLSSLRRRAEVIPEASAEPDRPGYVSMFLSGRWYSIRLPKAAGTVLAADRLDVAVLDREVLKPVLGIEDVRTDKRIDFVGGARGTGELERRVMSGEAAVAFSLYPVQVAELIAIADAGGIMPPKSTWFEPKLRDGLLVHLI